MTERSNLKLLSLGVLIAASTMGCASSPPPRAPEVDRAAPPAATAGPLKAAWICTGPVSGSAWCFTHDQGRRAVEARFGDRVVTTFVENVSYDDAERVVRDLVSRGNRIIFATSFGYGDAMKKVARDHPDVYFEHATGSGTAPNLRVYDIRIYEAAYLAGIVAGGTTRTNVLGFVATFPIPEVLRNINAYTLGARSINPKARTKVVWVYSWYDPPRATEAARSLMADGADVLLQNTDSPAVLLAAAKAGKHAFGWDADMSAAAPEAHLASCVLNWGPYYTKEIGDVLGATWTSGVTRLGIREGASDLLKVADAVPADVRRKVQEARDALVSDPGAVFEGPLRDNTGKEVLASGVVADERWKDGMSFFLEGVEGEVPPAR